MSLSQMTFDKVWTNPVDFPTHETQEVKVREDMQYLFDKIKNQFNNFITNEFTAENMSFAPIEGITASNVQDAIEYVFSVAQSYSIEAISDGAVTTPKLAPKAVTNAKIDDGAVDTLQLADGAVTADKVAEGALSGTSFSDNSIPAGKLAASSVGTNNLINNCVTSDKLANSAVITARLADLAVTTAKIADSAVSTLKIADSAITKDKIADLAVITGKINTGAVTSTKLAADSVSTEKIIDGNVTRDKLATAVKTEIEGKQLQHKTLSLTLEAGQTSWTKTGLTVIKANNTIEVAPDSADSTNGDTYWEQWCNCGIRCNGQSAGQLTFKARSATSANVKVNVLILD